MRRVEDDFPIVSPTNHHSIEVAMRSLYVTQTYGNNIQLFDTAMDPGPFLDDGGVFHSSNSQVGAYVCPFFELRGVSDKLGLFF